MGCHAVGCVFRKALDCSNANSIFSAAPPVDARPEAINFPTTTYEFNTDPAPFRPPASYPEPPRTVHYNVPAIINKHEPKLTPIFPWEEREASKPSRVFVEDEPSISPSIPEPEPEPEDGDEFRGGDELEVTSEERELDLPTRQEVKTRESMWQTFDAGTKNSWDDVPGIENYVRALSAHQRNRSNPQMLNTRTQPQPEQMHIISFTNVPNDKELIEKVNKRRESLILVDFPTAVERPSLPVTPAPIRRNTFWGGEREGEDDMPPAEGVPSQSEWVCRFSSISRIVAYRCDVSGSLSAARATTEELRSQYGRYEVTAWEKSDT